MLLDLTPEQLTLQSVIQRLLAQEYSFARRATLLQSASGFSAEFWRTLADQGALRLGLPASSGGLGEAREIMIVMEQFGRHLLLEPFVSTVVLGGGLLGDCGSREQQAGFLPKIIAGECLVALAHYERHGGLAPDRLQTVARPEHGRYVLNGSKHVVLDGANADLFIVSAQLANGGIATFLVASNAAGIRRASYRTQCGGNAADVELHDVEVPASAMLGTPATASDALDRAIARGTAAIIAEMLGAIDALNEITLEHLKTRRQFGRTIGSFQVLQHRMADMHMLGMQARSMSLLATEYCTHENPRLRRRVLSAAKAFVGKAARRIGQEAVQLHGASGLCDELPPGQYFKRLTMLDLILGDHHHHLAVFADQAVH